MGATGNGITVGTSGITNAAEVAFNVLFFKAPDDVAICMNLACKGPLDITPSATDGDRVGNADGGDIGKDGFAEVATFFCTRNVWWTFAGGGIMGGCRSPTVNCCGVEC